MLQGTVGNKGVDAAVTVGEVNIRMASMVDGSRRRSVEVVRPVCSSAIVVDFSA